jgi:hypothetical protein
VYAISPLEKAAGERSGVFSKSIKNNVDKSIVQPFS